MHAYSIVTPLSEKVMSLSGFPVLLSNFISAFPYYYSLMENLATRDPVWRENGTQFVTSVSKLLERLLDYRTVIQVRTDSLRLLIISLTINFELASKPILYIKRL